MGWMATLRIIVADDCAVVIYIIILVVLASVPGSLLSGSLSSPFFACGRRGVTVCVVCSYCCRCLCATLVRVVVAAAPAVLFVLFVCGPISIHTRS